MYSQTKTSHSIFISDFDHFNSRRRISEIKAILPTVLTVAALILVLFPLAVMVRSSRTELPQDVTMVTPVMQLQQDFVNYKNLDLW